MGGWDVLQGLWCLKRDLAVFDFVTSPEGSLESTG